MNIPPDENQLHAWLDGELDSASHQAVSDWLVQHPDIAAQVEG
ncbi:MAG: anti-sigma factor, partial [Pantoea sp. Morm]|nr:anti-sigma factor [Pantoea sp. Morm]